MASISESEITTEQNSHRVRRTFATILGGIGIVFLCLGLVSMVLIGFVSSPTSAKSTVKSALSSSAVREVIATELVKKIEEGGKDNSSEGVKFSVARPLIVSAVSNALGDPSMKEFAGEVAAKLYAVFVEDGPDAKIDISKFLVGTIEAIRSVDPSVPKDEVPTIDPLDAQKKPDDPNIKSIRDIAKTGAWLFLLVGILLQVAAWFLSVATDWKKLQRVGVRLAIGGAVFLVILLVVRARAPMMSKDNEDAVRAAANFITSPMLTRFVIMFIVGIISGVTGFLLHRRSSINQHAG